MFGHSQTACRGQLTCSGCASVGHASSDCNLEQKCVDCSQPHSADSKLYTAPTTSNSSSTSAASSSSNKALSSSNISMFTPFPAETCPVVENCITISNTIPSAPQAAKQTSRNRRKKRPNRSIALNIEIQLTPHKPQKSTPLQDTSDKGMLVYDVEEDVETSKKKRDE
ncbi:hypothetical protein TNCV_1790021 [Trichonephila clavipes]|nr:hypothetical protein TNCV_1790021 [Trichonephila clavipes]